LHHTPVYNAKFLNDLKNQSGIMKHMSSVDKSELIKKSAVELKKVKELEAPEWSIFVRTGANKERPPVEKDWWYTRAASLMIKTAEKGPIGVSKLRTEYGGKKRRGHKPAEFRRASGNILRKLMQQLEKAGLMKQHEIGVHKGRVLTPQGQSFINRVAADISKNAGPKPTRPAAGKPKAQAAGKPAGTKPKAEVKQGSAS